MNLDAFQLESLRTGAGLASGVDGMIPVGVGVAIIIIEEVRP
jgi:hypothetical protein